MIGFFSPTRFEIPISHQLKAKTFGMGERRARKLAQELNSQGEMFSKIFIFGSAGGLDEDVKAGDTFEVTEVHTETLSFQLQPRTQLPRARLFTSKRILSTTEKKRAAKEKYGASLVDMEMGFLWDSASEDVRSKLIFVRTVFDPLDTNLRFNWQTPVHLLRNYKMYLQGISRVLHENY